MTLSIRRSATLGVLALAAIASMAAKPPHAGGPNSSNVVTVTGDTAAAENDPGGWMFNRDPNNATPIQFTLAEASIGTGSLYVEPIGPTPAHKFIGEHFLLTPMSDVESISYDFLVGDGGDPLTDANEFYMNVYANFDGGTQFGDCVYSVSPVTSAGWTTMTFDPESSYPVRSRTLMPCPLSPSDLPAGASLRMFSLNLGDTTAADVGLDGYFDNVVVTTVGGTTIYDFEADKDVCKNGGWQQIGFSSQGQCIRYVNTGQDIR